MTRRKFQNGGYEVKPIPKASDQEAIGALWTLFAGAVPILSDSQKRIFRQAINEDIEMDDLAKDILRKILG